MSEWQPTPADWLAIGNDLRTVLGLPLLEHCDRIPTQEELDEYDRIIPGLSKKLWLMAQEESRHRQSIEEKKRGVPTKALSLLRRLLRLH